jgi:2-alkenal reductase
MTRSERILLGLGCLGLVAVLCLASAGTVWMVGSGAVDVASISRDLAPAAAGDPSESPENVPAELASKAADPSGDSAQDPAPAGLIQPRPSATDAKREALPLRGVSVEDTAPLARLYEQVNPGVVSVAVEQTISVAGQEFRQLGGGSGFVYDDAHIVTNNHVIASASPDSIEIHFYDGSRRKGKVIGADAYSDLAVIQVESMPERARSLPLEDDFDSLRVGQPAVAIGSPFGKTNSMTYGIISALGRTIPADLEPGGPGYGIPETIQTDAAINPGNSGGPLLNLSGEVIGINAQINTTNQQPGGVPGSSGVGFAIPSSIVAKVVPALIAEGKVVWSYLGVSGLPEEAFSVDVARANGLTEPTGAYLLEVLPDGPSSASLRGSKGTADAQGSVPVGGDIILAINGEVVHDFDDLLTYISIQTVPGQEVELTVLRDGKEIKARVTVGQRPDR